MISTLHALGLIHLLIASSHSDPPMFNGEEAYQILVDLSLRGQRYYEAPKRDEQLKNLSQLLSDHGQVVTIQTFTDQLPGQPQVYTLHNIIAQSPSTSPNRIVLGSHWDTRAWAEKAKKKRQQKRPIQGANDGTSGLAAILEILSVIQEHPLQNIAVDIIFFDGEELGKPGLGGYCKGSEHFAQHIQTYYAQPPVGVVVLDMIADHDLRLEKEYYSISSSPVLWSTLSSHLQAQNIPLNETPIAIKDDQFPFTELGIPSVLLIDMAYPYWHTPQDTIDKCSPQSLEKVGQALLNWLWAQDALYGAER